jgi:RNA recognition motif-containing protein
MTTKLYVGGLSYDTSDEGLRDAFAQAGTVASATVIRDRMTGRSRGFGFVEMSSDEEAQNAIRQLNGTMLDGRTVTVNEARPQGQGGARGGGRRGGGYGDRRY